MKTKHKILTIALVLIMLNFFTHSAYAEPDLHRIAVPGGNRYSTAGAVAHEKYSEAETVIIVRGDDENGSPQVVDALSASGLAGAINAPILLSTWNKLHEDTKATIGSLNAKKAVIVGGPYAISTEVEKELQVMGLATERIMVAGGDRYSTAGAVAKTILDKQPTNTAIIAGGTALVDSLIAGPLAHESGYPILLVHDNIPKETKEILQNYNIENLIIVGGTGVVSHNVQTELEDIVSGKVTRIAGDETFGKDRFGTSLAFANTYFPNDASVALVNGYSFVDAVGASILGIPIVYVQPDEISQEVEILLTLKSDFRAIGGTGVIADTVVNKAYEVLGTEIVKEGPSRITIDKTPYTQTLQEMVNLQSGEYLQVTGSVVNVRKGPGTDHAVIIQVHKDQLYEILGTGKDEDGFMWYKIDIQSLGAEEGTGWIFGGLIRRFIKPQTDLYSVVMEDAKWEDVKYYVDPGNFSSGWSSENMVTITATTLNVRQSAGTGHGIIATVHKGEEYEFLSTKNPGDGYTWYEINIQALNLAEKTGWVRGDWIRELDANEISIPTHFFQFLVLSEQSGAKVGDLNNILKNRGILDNTGQAFMEAGERFSINEIYLVSHALLETGNGTSTLATGVLVDEVAGSPVEPKVVYNMFGIGAVDNDALRRGSEYAYSQGWFTPEKSIVEGSQWIANRYVNNSTYQQDTLYKMRWNPESPGNHQYATDIGWAVKQTWRIKQLYDLSENYTLRFDIPEYKQ